MFTRKAVEKHYLSVLLQHRQTTCLFKSCGSIIRAEIQVRCPKPARVAAIESGRDLGQALAEVAMWLPVAFELGFLRQAPNGDH